MRVESDCRRALSGAARRDRLVLSAHVVASRSWASALFVGQLLTFAITAEDDTRLDEWLIALPDMELPVADHFVAGVEVVARSDRAATIELLVVEG
jgi:hypothetical protein